MENQPIVTVVTVCRNSKDALQTTMHNVLKQDYGALEYIVVDGCSSDGTRQLLETSPENRMKWVSEPDDGIYDAMNKAAKMATGEWVIFMNAGDCFASEKVLRHVFAESRQGVDVIYGDVVKGESVKEAEPPHNSHRMYFCHQSSFVRRELLLEHPFDTNHRMSADFKLMKTLYLNGCHFLQLHFPIARFDTTGISNTNRSKGLLDNIRVVGEVDSFKERLRLLPRLWVVYLICRIRGK